MERSPSFIQSARYLKLIGIAILAIFINSCTNDFDFKSNNKPAWLGESIYEQLQLGYTDEASGKKYNFSTFLMLIDDIGYKEVLERTGSKTLFVSSDEAFERFYASNDWGVTSYDQLTLAQKKLIINSAMINNAFLVELMSNTEGPVEGQALRRVTAVSYLDSISYETPENLPENRYWDRFRDNGLYLLKDNNSIPMLHFLQRQMDFKGISNEDFSYIFNGRTREKNDAHIYGVKIIVRDITCKNGYINVLEDVLIPPANMAEIIRTSPETKLYSRILERFAAPYYSAAATSAYKLLHPEFNDSIFVKRYFSERSSDGSNITDPKGVGRAAYLEYDPGWNTYALGTNMQVDMAAMFVPTDDAITGFFTSGGGKFLMEKYGEIDSIPDDVLDDLVRNMMKSTFNSTVPTKFQEILDDGKEPMGISTGDLVKTYVANNGVVYVTNKIYAPASYVAVTAPVMINENTRIFNWGVKAREFDAYLLSMDSHYSFLVPFDNPSLVCESCDGFYYVDPVSFAKTEPLIFKFWFKEPNSVSATAYEYNIETGEVGDSVRVVTPTEIANRMDDILDYHVVVGNIDDGKEYYQTKGGGQIKVLRNGAVSQLLGGGNLELGSAPEIHQVYDQTKETNGRGNGKTYLIDKPLLPPYSSVYDVLAGEPRFSEFFKLLEGSDETSGDDDDDDNPFTIFHRDPKYVGMNFNVKFFNTFHYSVYIPTNEAVLAAIDRGLPTWEMIKYEGDQAKKDRMSEILINFLKYHFQDNSVYIDGNTSRNIEYETAAFTLTGKKAYYKIHTELSANNLKLITASGKAVNVLKSNDLYNIMARDYNFNHSDIQRANQIETSSWAVIHQVDDVLVYDEDIFDRTTWFVKRPQSKRK